MIVRVEVRSWVHTHHVSSADVERDDDDDDDEYSGRDASEKLKI